jgi:hypothetical protein
MEYEYFLSLAIHQQNTDVITFIHTLKNDPIEWERIKANKQSIFFKACEHGKLDIMIWLLTIEPFTYIFLMDEELFLTACKGDYLHICQWIFFLSHDFDLREEDDLFFRVACEYNSQKVCEWILSKNPEIIQDHCKHVFHYACKYNRLSLVQYLINQYPLIIISYSDLYQCCMEGHLEIAKLIYPFVTEMSCSMINSLFTHVCVQEQFEIAKWLLYIEPSIDITINDQIAYICSAFDLAFFNKLYERHSYIPCEIQKEILFQLCVNGNSEHFEYFLKLFQDDIVIDQELLQYACQGGNANIVLLILLCQPLLQPNESIYLGIAKQGELDIFKLFENTCVYTTLQRCYLEAIRCAQLQFCKYLYNHYGLPVVSIEQLHAVILSSLIHDEYLSCLQWLLNLIMDIDHEELFETACIKGQIQIVKWLFPLLSGKFEKDEIFREVCKNSHYDVCLFLCSINDKYSYDISDDWELHPIVREVVNYYHLHLLSCDSCCICYENGNVMTDCNHFYCSACLTKTLAMHNYSNKCGMCRSKIKIVFQKLDP